jgi:hypothetical protein
MSIPYNLNIPFATHNPSVDQPNMETNNNSIATYVAVDHVGFNTTGSGQHNQVTFNANNIPAVPTAPPVLFTNTVGSLPQLFFYSGSAANGQNQYLAAPNQGSTFLLGGMIVKWGIANTNNPAVTTTFNQAFPNACFIVLLTNLSAAYTGSFAVTGFTAANFSAQRLSGTGITGAYFLALGY